MKKTVVLYPSLSVSHFAPMMQLAEVLVDAGYAVTVALIDPALKEGIALHAVVQRVAASKPSVSFHTLPRAEPDIDNPAAAVTHDAQFAVRYRDLVLRYAQQLHRFLRSMPPGTVHAAIVDVASGGLDVVKSLGIPAYMFLPMSASSLALFLQLPSMLDDGRVILNNEEELGLDATPLHFRGVPPIPASHLPREVIGDPESEVHKGMVDALRKIQEADGVLVKTFASLEPRAVAALADLPASPPVYCVGPLVADHQEDEQKHQCIEWLDTQPDRSVVYLCFGSMGMGNHSRDQLREIALGLENSGHGFLWVVRAPPPLNPTSDPDLDELLPAGFLRRTSGRGLVVKLWAPQVEVLRHRATGAFVTRCGWNSVLEAVAAGVPMLCWPLHSEQPMNKVVMVEEMGVGVELVGWHWQQEGLVKAEEVEAKVRMVLQSAEGEQLRARVAAHREAEAVAWKDGASSRAAFDRFLSDAEDSTLVAGTRPPHDKTYVSV